MKIDLDSIDKTQLMVHEHMLNGEMVYLVQSQHIGCDWTQANKIFRSSVWNALGELISAGFPKFTNWGEKPEQFPVPESLKGSTVMEKLDGSLLIVSKYKGNIILRTRGTVDASKLDNAAELEIFKQTILPKLEGDSETWPLSFLFEWVSPVNKIVLNYGDQPDWFLVGAVKHSDYSLHTQSELDEWAKHHGLKRPKTYTFKDVTELLDNVDQWKGQEGVCVYSKNGQAIHKVKSAWYLVRHHMKSELNNVEKVLDFWFTNGKPEFLQFKELVLEFDYELWDQVQGNASRISDAYKEVQRIIEGMRKFLREQVMVLNYNRRMQATIIKQGYGETNRASYLFTLLDGKDLDDKQLKKLMFQVLKKL